MATITTIYGALPESLLQKKEVDLGDGSVAVEYYYRDELVHRSAVIRLAGLQASGIAKL